MCVTVCSCLFVIISVHDLCVSVFETFVDESDYAGMYVCVCVCVFVFVCVYS